MTSRLSRSCNNKKKKRILVVNDEPDMTRMLKMTLERIGFIVDMFNDPVLAFRGFRQPVK